MKEIRKWRIIAWFFFEVDSTLFGLIFQMDIIRMIFFENLKLKNRKKYKKSICVCLIYDYHLYMSTYGKKMSRRDGGGKKKTFLL